MIKVSVTKQSNYPVKSAVIKKKLAAFFTKNGIVSDADVSVAIVGEKKMMEVGNKFLKDKKLHNVLSFVTGEVKGGFVYPPGSIIHLGEIIVCYPQAVREAVAENVLIDERVYELIEHGALHLMGIHHKE
jgi:probable rRNA maturation factor